MDATTRWNDLPIGVPKGLLVKDRMSWVRDHLDPPTPVKKDEVPNSATGSPVVRIHLPLRNDRHRIAAEVEDRSVRDWPRELDPTAMDLVAGPSIWVGLKYKADDSIGFNWNYLNALAPILRAARNDWKRARVRVEYGQRVAISTGAANGRCACNWKFQRLPQRSRRGWSRIRTQLYRIATLPVYGLPQHCARAGDSSPTLRR